MEESLIAPELDICYNINKPYNGVPPVVLGMTVNQISPASLCNNAAVPSQCRDVEDLSQSRNKGEHAPHGPHIETGLHNHNNPFTHAPWHADLAAQHRNPTPGGMSPNSIHFQLHPTKDHRDFAAARPREQGTRGPCSCGDCEPNQCIPRELARRDTTRLEREVEELEAPLPLRSDMGWQQYSPTPPHHHYMHPYNYLHARDVRFYHSAGKGQCRDGMCYVNQAYGSPPYSYHFSNAGQDARPWPYLENWDPPLNKLMNEVLPRANYSSQLFNVTVNEPQFSIVPIEGVSQLSVKTLCMQGMTGPPEAGANSDEKRKTISLPDECRNIFVTYSTEIVSEMVPFAEFLSKQGFRPAIDIFNNAIRRMDVNKWMDGYLKDQSVLIIIAISPQYKLDIEGSGQDKHGLHTKYIYSMMQNEFIQQGSLNFRFVPVLFLNATQRHVPGWLQNTRVYRWPQDREDLLLRLLGEERYIAPPVPMELTLIIRPVASNAANTL